MVRTDDPANRICPACAQPYTAIETCVVNGFYHDIVFVHLERVTLPGFGQEITIPRLCGPDLEPGSTVDIDPETRTIRIY